MSDTLSNHRKADEPGTDSDFIRGTYRRLGTLNAKLDRLIGLLEKVTGANLSDAEQLEIPGLPKGAWTPPDTTPPPRIWTNTVRVYDILWQTYGAKPFTLADMIRDCPERIAGETDGRKISVATYPRVLSALVKAGAAAQKSGVYTLTEPSDDLRALVEATRSKKPAKQS